MQLFDRFAVTITLMTAEGKLQPSYVQVLVKPPDAAPVHLEFVAESAFSLGGNQSAAGLKLDALPALSHIQVTAAASSLTVAAKDPRTELWLSENNRRADTLRAEHTLLFKIGRSGPEVTIKRGMTATFGNYLLTGRLGGGGMADVYAARQLGIGGFNRQVAVKLIQPHMSAVKNAEQMFLEEARIAAEVNHHNTAKIIEIGEHDGILYIAMEYIDGISVSDLMGQFYARQIHFPAELVAALIAQACYGLHALHELRDPAGRPRNVVHRDVSPSNLMLSHEGLLKVIDFGLARDNTQERTTGRVLKGKPSYMSPEQVGAQKLDRRSDVFALGVILFEMLTAKSPFSRDDVIPTLYAVVNDPPPPLEAFRTDVPLRLGRAIYAALEKDRERRMPTAAALGAELQLAMMEGGGHFLSAERIATFLGQQKFVLQSPQPAPLLQLPQSLAVRPVSSKGAIISAPGRLVGTALAGSPYMITRYLGQRVDESAGLHKLLYLAQVSSDKANAPPADFTRPGGGTNVILALCGQGPELSALNPAQVAALEALATARHRTTCPAYLVPIFHTGQAWESGPTYLVMPVVESRLLLDNRHLPAQAHDRLTLVTALWSALARARQDQPRFVHGDIKPENLGLRSTGELQVVLLDFNLQSSLALPLRPPAHPSAYTAPECIAGQPANAAADVFAAAAVSFALLGGDVTQLQESLARGTPRPHLPPNSFIHAGVDLALGAALVADPERRPAASEILKRLQRPGVPAPAPPVPPPLPPAAARARPRPDVRRLAPPPLGTEQRLTTPSGLEVILYSLEILPSRQRAPTLLPLSHVPGLLPAPLQVLGRTNGVVAELGEPSGHTKHRPSIYHNALEPSTRCDSLLIASTVENTHIDVGHRKLWVQRIFIKCQARVSARDALLLYLPELGLEIEAASSTDRLIAFQTTAAASGTVHVALVLIKNSAL